MDGFFLLVFEKCFWFFSVFHTFYSSTAFRQFVTSVFHGHLIRCLLPACSQPVCLAAQDQSWKLLFYPSCIFED